MESIKKRLLDPNLAVTNVKPEDINKEEKMEKVVEQVALTTTKTFRPRRVLPRRKKGMQLEEVEELNKQEHPYYAPQIAPDV